MARTITRSDTNKAIVSRQAVFVRQLRDGKYVYIREPYDLVSYDRSHQTSGANKHVTYAQPRGGIVRPNTGGTGYQQIGTDSISDVEELYDEILVLDKPDPRSPFRDPRG